MTSAIAGLHGDVQAMVRRRVPAGDAEDVTQTVLCDALAARRLPRDPEELRRFVSGIARHKVADFHRRARRDAEPVDPEQLVAAQEPVEERALLRAVLASAETARDRQALEWIVREHQGEELREIARSEGLPAPTVRQRVSRFRRLLRERWAHALAFAIVLGACGAFAESRESSYTIVADPRGDAPTRAIGLVQGTWHVANAWDAAGHVVPYAGTITIAGDHVTIGTKSRTIRRASVNDAGVLALDLDGERVTVTMEADGVTVASARGRARLVR